MKLIVKKTTIYSFGIMTLLIISILIMPTALAVVLSIVLTILLAILSYNGIINNQKIGSLTLLFPLMCSAFQNVYLAMASPKLSPIAVQILLSLHLLYVIVVIGLFCLNTKIKDKSIALISTCLLFILIQSTMMLLYNGTNIVSFLSSLRNVIACMLFYLLAVFVSKKYELNYFLDKFSVIMIVVSVFGLIEFYIGNKLWVQLGVTKLWELKGIAVNVAGVPCNWYSSELIGGQQVRRMVATFADPVNLGSVLFVAFMVAWYQKRKMLCGMLAICCVLTMSKGALLGFLVFFIFYIWFHKKFKVFVPLATLISFVCGVLFIIYSKSSSTGSVFAHIAGLKRALVAFESNPFGIGVGETGVLAALFSKLPNGMGVGETGLGVLMVQLGVPGIIVFLIFYLYIFRQGMRISNNYGREKTLYFTLLFSFVAIMMFNEVALSPNSCASYFIIMGLMSNLEIKERYTI